MTAGKIIPAYALTTRERIKERLQITDDAHDTPIDRLVKQVSDYVQNKTNRKFLKQTYKNEVYSVYGEGQVYLLLNQAPVFQLQLSGLTITTGSNTVTAVPNTNGIVIGMQIIGDGIPGGTTITGFTSNSITMSNNATASTSDGYAVVNGLMKLQYRAGLPSNPSWTDFTTDQFELLENGETGIVRVYGPLSLGRFINNSVRATYEAGYLIDFDNETDPTKHTLPGDLTMLAENLISRWWTRRKNAGRASEAMQGATIQWDRELDPVDTELLQQFARTPRFF